MSPWVRRIGMTVAIVLALLTAAIAIVYGLSERRMRRVYRIAATELPARSDSAALARGRHIADAIGKCAECHGEDFGGKVMSDDALLGRLVGVNLTRGRGGIGDLTDADLERAIRHGIGPDGHPLLFMPAEAFQRMTDDDLAALIAYLRTLPPVDRAMPPSRPGPLARTLFLTVGYPLVPAELVAHDRPRPAVPAGVSVEYGEYLATIGGCRSCHGSELRGDGMPGAPDLTRTRIASWTEGDFMRALRQGTRPDGSAIDPLKMPWVATGRMTDDEVRAVWAYARSLAPTAQAGQ